jgi:hypothetical protein
MYRLTQCFIYTDTSVLHTLPFLSLPLLSLSLSLIPLFPQLCALYHPAQFVREGEVASNPSS